MPARCRAATPHNTGVPWRVLKKFLVTRFIDPFSYKNLSDQGTFSTLSTVLEGVGKVHKEYYGLRRCRYVGWLRGSLPAYLTALVRHLKRLMLAYGPPVVTALAGLIGALAMTLVAIAEGVTLHWSAEVWGALPGLAIGCGAAAYLLWWHAAKQLPISQAGVFLYLTPVVSTLLGILVLGEPLTVATAAGAGLVLSGMALVQA